VLNGLPGINPLYAPRLVLLAVPGADAVTVDQYIGQRRRNRRDGLEPPEPPVPASRFVTTGRGGSRYTVQTEARVGPVVRTRFSAQVQRRGRAERSTFTLSRMQREPEPLFDVPDES
jgi:general secretion pathway protein K